MNKSGYVEFMATARAENNWAQRERPQAALEAKSPTTWRDLGSKGR